MNIERLQNIYHNIAIADKTDIEDVRQLTEDYPFYALPYVILSKYYFETKHYRFDDMLRQAAMRVKDRKALYNYIHGVVTEVQAEPITETYTPEALIHEQEAEPEILTSVLDFLETDITEQAPEAPEQILEAANEEVQTEELETLTHEESPALSEEFVIDTHSDTRSIDKIEIDYDIIGEEIETEFSFSKSFGTGKETPVSEPEEEHNIADNTGTSEPEVANVHSPDEHLRKYPVYSIDNYFKDQAPTVTPSEDDVPSPERDFFAWLKAPKTNDSSETKAPFEQSPTEIVTEEKEEESGFKKPGNLDLIDKFISINPQISRPKKEFFNPENMAKRSEVIDLEFVSETLANIYYEQGNYDMALKAYEKLSLQNPSKESYFADLIEKIKKERK
jgi:tetratricopeptide (TPR) repeat protein